MTVSKNKKASSEMKFSQWVREEAIVIDLQASDKWEALDQLVDKLLETGQIASELFKSVREAIIAREKSMSTGMERGIAIPHAAVDGVQDLCVALGVFPQGVAFESIDGMPAHIVIMLVIPRSKKLVHIRTLAEVARLLSREGLRQKMIEAQDAKAVLDAIKQEEGQQATSG